MRGAFGSNDSLAIGVSLLSPPRSGVAFSSRAVLEYDIGANTAHYGCNPEHSAQMEETRIRRLELSNDTLLEA